MKAVRQWRTVDGQQECTCSSCEAFYPATRKWFYFRGRGGCLGPDSWCKACYAANRAAKDPSRVGIPADPDVVPIDIIRAQRDFVRLPAVTEVALLAPVVRVRITEELRAA